MPGRARLADVDRVACRAPELAAAGDVSLALARAVTADGVPCVCVVEFFKRRCDGYGGISCFSERASFTIIGVLCPAGVSCDAKHSAVLG